MLIKNTYYFFKPLIPRRLQIIVRKKVVQQKLLLYKNIWPIDEKAGKPPIGWTGWPDHKRFVLVLTHDVDGPKGLKKCLPLINLEKSLGFKSSFNFVAEDYPTSIDLFQDITSKGFEVGVHGLTHSENLFRSRKLFEKKAHRINTYLQNWNSVGFRAPCMYHNLDWIHDLNIEYDTSTFDTDPFEPQPDGMKTIFPFWVQKRESKKGYVELPYTLHQDFLLFILMQKKNIDIWKQKLDWVVEQGGMALVTTHPDYMNFGKTDLKYDEYPAEYYEEFLNYIRSTYKDQYWHVLPNEIAQFWKNNYSKHF